LAARPRSVAWVADGDRDRESHQDEEEDVGEGLAAVEGLAQKEAADALNAAAWRGGLHAAVWARAGGDAVRRALADETTARGGGVVVGDAQAEERGVTALLLAVVRGAADELAALVDEPEVEVDFAGGEGVRALFYAAAAGKVDAARRLLRAGANPCLLDRRAGVSAAHIAAERGRLRVLRLLLDEFGRADLANLPSRDGLSPLHHVAATVAPSNSSPSPSPRAADSRSGGDRGDIVDFLVQKHAVVDAASPQGVTPLMLAAHVGAARVTARLLAAGADQLLRSRSGFSAVHFAARAGHTDVLDLLLASYSGALLEAAAGDAGRTPLHLAAAGGHVAAVRSLLRVGANATARDAAGRTPLLCAAAAESDLENRAAFREIAEMLVAARASIDARGPNGDSALHVLALRGDPENIAWCIAHGADPLLRNQDGDSPWQLVDDDLRRAAFGSATALAAGPASLLTPTVQPTSASTIAAATESYAAETVGSASMLVRSFVWENDADVPHCRGCATAFTLLRRKHHCRGCGRIYCAQCSNRRISFQGAVVRICGGCFTQAENGTLRM
jgi:ankyrin repeat protein